MYLRNTRHPPNTLLEVKIIMNLSEASKEQYEQFKFHINVIYSCIFIGLIGKLISIASFGKALPFWGLITISIIAISFSYLLGFLIYKRYKAAFLGLLFLGLQSILSLLKVIPKVEQWNFISFTYFFVLGIASILIVIVCFNLNKRLFPNTKFFSL